MEHEKLNNQETVNSDLGAVSGSLEIYDARERAKNVYAKITSYANYKQMNGIENTWFIECIAEELVKVSKNYR